VSGPPLGQANGSRAKASPALASKTGSLSTVSLVEARRLTAEEATRSSAHGGLRLTFLVARSSASSGPFSLSELRDMTVDGKSYADTTFEAMKRRFEPQTSIEEPRNVRLGTRTVDEAFKVGGTTAVVMVTTLYGGTVPAKGDGALTLKVGWGQRLEEFAFRFDLARLP
jgi:hypothetical protein